MTRKQFDRRNVLLGSAATGLWYLYRKATVRSYFARLRDASGIRAGG